MAIACTRVQYGMHDSLLRRPGDEQIDESCACNLDPLYHIRFRQGRDQRLRDIAWRFAQRLGKLHRQIAGIVAVARLFGALDQNRCTTLFGCDLLQRLREQFRNM